MNESWKKRLKEMGNPVALASAGLALLVIGSLMPVPVQAIDLASHFMAHYMFCAIILLMIAPYLKTPKFYIILLCLVLGTSASQVAPFLPFGAHGKADKPLKVLQANVLYTQPDTEPMRKLLLEQSPDIAVVSEVTPAFAKMFAKLKKEYPYQDIHAKADGARGLAVISRLPLKKAKLTHFIDPRIPSQEFTVSFRKQDITFLSVHPTTPIDGMERRDREFKLVAEKYAGDKMPRNFILIGDFNATPWCHAFKTLQNSLSLRNARIGQGVNASWPAHLPSFMRIPIDHLLATRTVNVHSYRVLPFIKSDHLPMMAELSLQEMPE